MLISRKKELSQKMKKMIMLVLAALMAVSLTACGTGESPSSPSSAVTPADQTNNPNPNETASVSQTATQLTVRFGDQGAPFTLYLEDNSTAAAIARHVGTADWRLPIYHFDDYEGWESFQYYDIPSRYEIPSNAQTVTTEQAGQLYYSEPNRIVLFYHNGEISGEYTLVGHFDATEEFIAAVENNPVLEGWGNKLVLISAEH